MDQEVRSRSAWDRLVRPQHICMVGASGKASSLSFTRRLLDNNALLGFKGHISFVNPKRDEIYGVPCYPALEAVPEPIDLLIVATPSKSVTETVRAGIALGVRSFVVHSGDFAEAGHEGKQRQKELVALCATEDMVVVGPNCLGAASVAGAAAYGALLPETTVPGEISVITQSGSVAATLLDIAAPLGLNFVASTGNEAVTSTEDLVEHLLDEGSSRVFVLFVEALRNPGKFRKVAERARREGRAILLLKAGMTAAGESVSRSHTGSIGGGNGTAHRAFFEQLGVGFCEDFDELAAAVRLFAGVPHPPPRVQVAVLGTSGGKLASAADDASRAGVTIPQLAPDTVSAVRAALNLPADIAVPNPVDVGMGFRSPLPYDERFRRSMRALSADPEVDALVVHQDLACDAEPEMAFNREMIRAALAESTRLDIPVIFSSAVSGVVDAELAPDLRAAAVAVVPGGRSAMRAIATLDRWTRWTQPASGDGPWEKASRFPEDLAVREGVVQAAQARRLLAAYELPLVESMLASKREDLAQVSDFPVVVKVASADILHKTEVGGVRTGIRDEEELAAAMSDIKASVASAAPWARVDGFEVSPQIAGFCELLMGAFTDPSLGPVVTVGLGGIQAEALSSVSMLVPPFTRAQAMEALSSFSGSRVLQGFRGHAPADLAALAAHLQQLGKLMLDAGGRIEAVDLNPVIVGAATPGGCIVDFSVLTAD